MTERISVVEGMPGAMAALGALAGEVDRAAADAGLDPSVLELVRVRASQLNGCAYCLDLHTSAALSAGEEPRRLHLLAAWRAADRYDERERAALALTEALTPLTGTRDVPPDVYAHATEALTEAQYRVVVWTIAVINTYNRVAVPSHPPLP